MLVDEGKADKNNLKWRGQMDNKYSFNYSDEEGEAKKSIERKQKRELKNKDNENKESSNLDKKDENELALKSSTNPKNQDSGVLKNSLIDLKESNQNMETYQNFDSPFLIKDHPFNTILEKLAKIMKTSYPDKSTDIYIENEEISNKLDNPEDIWWISILSHLPPDLIHLITSYPIFSIVISILIWSYRLLPWIKTLREYLEVRKTRKGK